ncbi:Crp/Fnr family transcriptional regulator [Streptantibioticus rubrisoli]|uniref:Crp/Fnr family transcriptional regulator n=1 Tax=Streptantibioticus rubrisoli TaxID=1387313 RepID=A0ABT1P8X6_9ACTN|nr:Crp/Fnr family transcriptional regulator [Streptantibioticus rubrisoli]MCQ4040878.1 Crp/Fnr family transcriptional regulator [Streptantibioticus rubrisoli]
MSPVRFWDLLTEAERAELVGSGHSRRFHRGERVFSEAEDDGSTAVIASGKCRVVAHGEDGVGTYLALRGEGDIIGEMAAIRGGPRSATVTVVSPLVMAHVFAKATFHRLLAARPALTAHLLVVMIERLREADQCQADLAVASTELRFNRLLLRLARAEGVHTRDGVEIAGVTQLDLAGWCGISRESVGRHVRRLQSNGVLAAGRSRGRLVVRDLEALRHGTLLTPS